jgi:SAM-dependent methyltransferase
MRTLAVLFAILQFGAGTIHAEEKDLTTLANLYQSDKGSAFASFHHYTRHYEKLLAPYKEKKFNLLEIGLNVWERKDCASLKMWLDYFPHASIYGIDISPQTFTNQRVNILIGDQADVKVLQACAQACKDGFDVIIDDGSHKSLDQQKSLVGLFSALKPGGLYIIEDLHFQPSPEETGIEKTRALLERMQKNEREPLKKYAISELYPMLDEIESIEFFDSVSFGEKCLAAIRKKKSKEAL